MHYNYILATVVEGDLKAAFSRVTPRGLRVDTTPFPGFLNFTIDAYFIMLSVEQRDIKYNFLSFWYDSTWDWTPVSRVISERSNH